MTLPYGSYALQRIQFPLRLAYATTINKGQGQTFQQVLLDLQEPCFQHGQLYVAFSRIRHHSTIKVYCKEENITEDGRLITANVVFPEYQESLEAYSSSPQRLPKVHFLTPQDFHDGLLQRPKKNYDADANEDNDTEEDDEDEQSQTHDIYTNEHTEDYNPKIGDAEKCKPFVLSFREIREKAKKTMQTYGEEYLDEILPSIGTSAGATVSSFGFEQAPQESITVFCDKNATHEQILLNHLIQTNNIIISIAGNGSCLYNSIIYQNSNYEYPEDAPTSLFPLRNKVADFILENLQILDMGAVPDYTGTTLSFFEYLENIRHNKKYWADENQLVALAHIIRRPISTTMILGDIINGHAKIVTLITPPFLHDAAESLREPVHIIFRDNNHYEAVQNMNLPKPQERYWTPPDYDIIQQLPENQASQQSDQQTTIIDLDRIITDEEIENYIYGPSNDDTIIDKFNVNFTRRSIVTLRDNTWINDEVINFYMQLLNQREDEISRLSIHSLRRPCYFFSSFFVAKLLEGDIYDYTRVKRWTRNTRRQQIRDIFTYHELFFPINIRNSHWAMATINITNKTINYYDSQGHPGTRYLQALKRWLDDESKDKCPNSTLNIPSFNMQPCDIAQTPQQIGSTDCGVFSMMYADYLSTGRKLTGHDGFSQVDIHRLRRSIAKAILWGELDINEDSTAYLHRQLTQHIATQWV